MQFKMQNAKTRTIVNTLITVTIALAIAVPSAMAQPGTAAKIPQSALIQAADLAKALQMSGRKPVILQVGSHILFTQAHVPGAEYMGAASSAEGIAKLRARVKALKKSDAIVLYCGCCPWEHCPNIAPAYKELRSLGFNHVKVLYLASNFGADWVYKGFPTAKGD
jgi:thiosulfate/3-mercaptopyruvate sulfurtransferase